MFFHSLKYNILSNLRKKDVLFWLIIFPIVLGTFFKIAFGSIYDKTTKFSAVPVAVVENTDNEIFHTVMDEITKSEDPLFTVKYIDEDEALKLLKDKDIDGIIYIDDKLSVTVSDSGIEQTIIKTFVEQYTLEENIISDAAASNPQKLESIVKAFGDEIKANENIPLTDGNTDYFITYFYNLIAMVALLGSDTGLRAAIEGQGNLSALGARKGCSPTPKYITLAANVMSSYMVQSICTVISITFIRFVLRVDFGSRLPLVYLAGIAGSILGVSLGFMIGSFGSISQNAKMGISMTVSMLSCFLSGLMVGNMKAIIMQKAPWFNQINPAAVISDAFYCLNIYSDYDKFITKIITMVVLSVIFNTIGLVMTRRRKYASI